jgi:hypothetical protein
MYATPNCTILAMSGTNDGRFARIREGFLCCPPVLGASLVFLEHPDGTRVETTPVQRILAETNALVLWVETRNTRYRITLHGRVPVARWALRRRVAR